MGNANKRDLDDQSTKGGGRGISNTVCCWKGSHGNGHSNEKTPGQSRAAHIACRMARNSISRAQAAPMNRGSTNVPRLCGTDTLSTGRFISDKPAATKPHFIMGAQKNTVIAFPYQRCRPSIKEAQQTDKPTDNGIHRRERSVKRKKRVNIPCTSKPAVVASLPSHEQVSPPSAHKIKTHKKTPSFGQAEAHPSPGNICTSRRTSLGARGVVPERLHPGRHGDGTEGSRRTTDTEEGE